MNEVPPPASAEEEARNERCLTTFEWSLWRIANAFVRWQADCINTVNDGQLSGHDAAVLHVIGHREKAKGLSEIARMLGRDDPANIQYSIKKLISLGLIERVAGRSRKETIYEISEEGRQLAEEHVALRRKALVPLLAHLDEVERNLLHASDTLDVMTALYETASRRAATAKR